MEDTPAEDLTDKNQSTTASRKSRRVLTKCKVCEAPALYSYAGAVVCSSCKIFFRRNARIEQVI